MVRDDTLQAQAADEILNQAATIAVALSSLCEFVWVLHSFYGLSKADISSAVRTVLSIGNVVVNRPAVQAGLAALDAGGDFADGVIAYEGGRLGADTFVSFDRKAVSVLSGQGFATRLLR